MPMTNKELSEYHRSMSKIYHERAQVARREKLRLKEQRRFVEALQAESRWKEYQRERDNHKAQSREYAALV